MALDAQGQTPNRANVTTTTNGVLTGSSTNFFTLNSESGTNATRTVGANGILKYSVNPALTNIYSILFQSGVTPAHAESLLFYDSTDHSLTYYNDEADVSVNIGREMWARVRNSTGATIVNGAAVYVSGATGQLPTVTLAQADAESTSQLIGIATHDIEDNSNGYVTIVGEVKGLDTSSFNDGDVLYLSPSSAGSYTTTKPTAPNLVVRIGIVEHAHVTQGKILVHPDIQSIASTSIYDSTSAGRGLLTAADAAAQRTLLGLGTMATESTNSFIRGVAAGSNVTTSTNNGVVTVNATGGGGSTFAHSFFQTTNQTSFASSDFSATPVYTEGTAVMTNSITLTAGSTNAVIIRGTISYARSTPGGAVKFAVFRGTTLVGSGTMTGYITSTPSQIPFLFRDVPSSSGPHEYIVRLGAVTSQTIYFNSGSSPGLNSTASATELQEFLP